MIDSDIEGAHKRAVQKANYILRNVQDAEDAAQEAFISAERNKDRINEGKYEGYVVTCAANRALDVARWRSLRKHYSPLDSKVHQPEDFDVSANPEAHALRNELSDAVKAAINELPAKQRTIVLLTAIAGKTQPEVAEILGVPVGTIKSASSRAHNFLRKALACYK